MRKGSLEMSSREVIVLILVIIIVVVVLLIGFGFFDKLKDFVVGFGTKGAITNAATSG
jgi:hypothetical protein